MDTWTVAEAKAKFSQLLDEARSRGPQTVTRNGRIAVVVVAAEEWERKVKRRGNLAEFLLASPLRESGVKIRGPRIRPRKAEL
jgi:prevent-host-death family protein